MPVREARVGVAVAVLSFAVVGGTVAVHAQGPWSAPADVKSLKNQVTGVGAAATSVQTNCASCHGPGGKGDGPAAAALPAKPADWTSEHVQKQSDGELYWKISNGRGSMPGWKHLSEKERWEMVNYIRTLKK